MKPILDLEDKSKNLETHRIRITKDAFMDIGIFDILMLFPNYMFLGNEKIVIRHNRPKKTSAKVHVSLRNALKN